MSNADVPPGNPIIPVKKKLNKNKNKNVENVEINNLNNNPNNLIIPLMRIPTNIFSVNSQALVDTGAAASFVSLELLKKLPNEKLIEEERYPA